MVRNNMINLFQRQKEMSEQITLKETELYGMEGSMSIGSDNKEDLKLGNNKQASGAKKEKKHEPKEYSLKSAYKHLWQFYMDIDSEEFEALRLAALCPKRATDGEKDEFFEELITEGESSRINQNEKMTKSQKKKKEKPESTMLDVLATEDHQIKLRNDRKNTIQLIQFYNNRPNRKI